PDLAMLTSNSDIRDHVILEFDVIPRGDQLYIDFVFASEEYPENVCSDLADVMGIFISGPGIAGPFSGGAQNFAVVFGTSINIGLNSINSGTPGINGLPGGCGTDGL